MGNGKDKEQEIEGDVPESDVEEPKPEWRQETQLQETNEKMITESEKEAINQRFRERRGYEAGVVLFGEDNDDDVEQKCSGSWRRNQVHTSSVNRLHQCCDGQLTLQERAETA